ncbi:MAG: hypothetical protein JWM64_2209 [Frankiales bacterium]|nr:hypothetical protein [Frankiales bacterium]
MLLGAVLRFGPGSGPDCTVAVGGDDVGLSRAQARDATTLAGVTRRDGRTQADLARALDARLDDADGALTPGRAARLLDQPGGTDRLPLARALLGYGTGRLVCDDDPRGGLSPQQEGSAGLTPRAARVREAVRQVFGTLPQGGFEPGGVSSGHVPGSAHYEGRAVDTFFRPLSPRHTQEGWTLAQYLVAHAERLDVDVVIFDRRIWSSSRSGDGWRTYVHPAGPTTNPVLLHLDHVHVDVLRGSA